MIAMTNMSTKIFILPTHFLDILALVHIKNSPVIITPRFLKSNPPTLSYDHTFYPHILKLSKKIEHTTQNSHTPESNILKTNYKSPFPVLNVHLRHKLVATYTFYFSAPTIDDGDTLVKKIGKETLLTEAYGMNS